MPDPTQEETKPVDMNIDDLLDLSDDDIDAAVESDEFDDAGAVSLPDDVNYLEFKTPELMKSLKPFMQKKMASRDIIAKSILFRVLPEGGPGVPPRVAMYATDTMSYLCAHLEVKNNNFLPESIIDAESFSVVANTTKTKTYLIERSKLIYSTFFGGEMFIPSYSMAPTLFMKDFGKELNRADLNSLELMDALTSLSSVLVSSEVPDLCYIFFDETGAYASNGVLVARSGKSFPKFVVRQPDVQVLRYMLEAVPGEKAEIIEYDKFYEVKTESFSYAFPKVGAALSDNYKDTLEDPDGKFFINYGYFNSVLSTLNRMPEDAGILEMRFGDILKGISRTRKGEESGFEISNSKEGEFKDEEFSVHIKALKVALSVFSGQPSVECYFKSNKVLIQTESKRVAIILKKA